MKKPKRSKRIGRRGSLAKKSRDSMFKRRPEEENNPNLALALSTKKGVWSHARRKAIRQHYVQKMYKDNPKKISFSGSFGLEADIKDFVEKASSFLDNTADQFSFDLLNCTRFWPSAVLLLVSFEQYCRLVAKNPPRPTLWSTDPQAADVDSYLMESGFYDFIKRRKKSTKKLVADSEIVKIEPEYDLSNIKKRQMAIRKLISSHGGMSDDDVEDIDCNILSELFTNVSEHGIYRHTKNFGCYSVAQVHRNTGIISVCIADNGMGIKNTLVSGPQKKELKKSLDPEKTNDAKYILKSLEPSVSGAFRASVQKEGILKKKRPKGSRRGYGLFRVQEACKRVGLELTIISNNGCIRLSPKGKKVFEESKKSTIFPGTFYFLKIPINKVKRD